MDRGQAIRLSMSRVPEVEGPVPVTERSYPFCSMAHCRQPLDLSAHGWEEREFFLSGTVQVYDADGEDRPVVAERGLSYKNRVLLRRPSDPSRFSGRVYVDILNATQGYDIEDLWHRHYYWCLEHGHGYVGITSKPVNVLSLKYFDYDRYRSLDWTGPRQSPQPSALRYASIPGTEEGMVWDMLGQVAALLHKRGGEDIFFGKEVAYLYLTGQSQSGAYLNTFIHYFDEYLPLEPESRLYDGYLNVAGAQIMRNIRQSREPEPLVFNSELIRAGVRPYISVACEGDMYLFQKCFQADVIRTPIPNSAEQNASRRHYEVAGSPHTDICCPLLSTDQEVAKTGRSLPNLEMQRNPALNDFPTEYYVVGLLERLHRWVLEGKAPPVPQDLQRTPDGADLQRDVHGNVIGGVRSPLLDVPVASYAGYNPEDAEGISGTVRYFSKAEVLQMYGSLEEYKEQFTRCTREQIEEGWLTETDGEKMLEWMSSQVFRLQKDVV